MRRLLPLVYAELKQMAAGQMAGQSREHTLQATALVHEIVLRLIQGEAPEWNDRHHFFSVAARAMRQVLVDHARTRNRAKRSPGGVRVDLDGVEAVIAPYEKRAGDLEALNEALARLREMDARAADLVDLRFILGLTMEQCAFVMGMSKRNVEREWTAARAHLARELKR